MSDWATIHAVLWAVAAGQVYTAWTVDRDWRMGWWDKARPWFVRLCLAAAVWDIYVAGSMIPWELP